MARGSAARAGSKQSDESEGPRVIAGGADTPGLDRVIHQPVRLAIVSSLAVNESLSFAELRSLLDLTDGNLSVHARKLEEEGYVDCSKGYEGRIPRTDYRLTERGRRALERYLGHMESLIRAVRTD